MLLLWEKPILWYSQLVWVAMVAWCYYAINYWLPRRWPDAVKEVAPMGVEVGPESEAYELRKWSSVHWAVLGGLFAANSNILFKSAGEFSETSISDGDNTHWGRY